MIKAAVQQQKSELRLISGWKYASPSGSHLIGQGWGLHEKSVRFKLFFTVLAV
jgi:hypothetical protein